MKEGLKMYIDVSIGELQSKKEARDMIKQWEETVEYIRAEVEKVINNLSGK